MREKALVRGTRAGYFQAFSFASTSDRTTNSFGVSARIASSSPSRSARFETRLSRLGNLTRRGVAIGQLRLIRRQSQASLPLPADGACRSGGERTARRADRRQDRNPCPQKEPARMARCPPPAKWERLLKSGSVSPARRSHALWTRAVGGGVCPFDSRRRYAAAIFSSSE
jgi:hypothetical protein